MYKFKSGISLRHNSLLQSPYRATNYVGRSTYLSLFCSYCNKAARALVIGSSRSKDITKAVLQCKLKPPNSGGLHGVSRFSLVVNYIGMLQIVLGFLLLEKQLQDENNSKWVVASWQSAFAPWTVIMKIYLLGFIWLAGKHNCL